MPIKGVSGLVVLAVLLLWGTIGETQPVPSQSVPTKITSDKMTVRNQEQEAIFNDNVVLTRGTLNVQSDKMVVLYKDQQKTPTPDSQPAGNSNPDEANKVNIDRIVASGRVKIKRDKGHATCQQAIYYLDQQKIVLTGKPVAWQEGNRVSGEKIIMFLEEDRTVVEGGSQVILDSAEGEAR